MSLEVQSTQAPRNYEKGSEPASKQNTITSDSYTFSAEPKAVQPRKAKFRRHSNQQQNEEFNKNENALGLDVDMTGRELFFDSRVQLKPGSNLKQQWDAKKEAIFNVEAPDVGYIPVNLSSFLEEQKAPVVSCDISTQTDEFASRPVSKKFQPRKTGIDVSTQIVEGDGLFSFDAEVEPILSVLLGKTMEQSVLELEHEEELDRIRQRKGELEVDEELEMERLQSLEEDEVRRWEDSRKLIHRNQQRVSEEAVVSEKVASIVTSRNISASATDSALAVLEDCGFFVDPSRVAVEQSFMPWLYTKVKYKLKKIKESHDLVDSIVRVTIEKGRRRAEKRKCWIRVIVKRDENDNYEDGNSSSSSSNEVVGPVSVLPTDHVSDVIQKIEKWMEKKKNENVANAAENTATGLQLYYDGEVLPVDAPLLKRAPFLQRLEVRCG
eukprot:g5702.t1